MMTKSNNILSLALRPITSIYPKLWFQIIPEPLRFMSAAGFGNIIFFYIDAILYELVIHPLSICDYEDFINSRCGGGGNDGSGASGNMPSKFQKVAFQIIGKIIPSKTILKKNKESISFFFSYLIQIVAQHFLNAFFVYGLESISTREKYVNTLVLTYSS